MSEREPFPIVRRPDVSRALPVLVTIPHYGVEPIPGIEPEVFAKPGYESFVYGYADAFAASLYGSLHEIGATVLASPYSRLFVDLNRRRDDYELEEGALRSHRGIARTHTIRGDPIFAEPLTPEVLEERLRELYDPFHAMLERLAAEGLERFGYLLLLDAHTGSERGMGTHQIVIGTRRGRTSDPALAARAAEMFRAHGYRPEHDVRGYSGGHIVRRFGAPRETSLHAIQIEVNSSLLMGMPRREFIERVTAGERPAGNRKEIDRLRACLSEMIRAIAAVLPALTTGRRPRDLDAS